MRKGAGVGELNLALKGFSQATLPIGSVLFNNQGSVCLSYWKSATNTLLFSVLACSLEVKCLFGFAVPVLLLPKKD